MNLNEFSAEQLEWYVRELSYTLGYWPGSPKEVDLVLEDSVYLKLEDRLLNQPYHSHVKDPSVLCYQGPYSRICIRKKSKADLRITAINLLKEVNGDVTKL